MNGPVALLSCGCLALLAAACGGNVVVDQPASANGGAGGSSSTTTSTWTTSTSTWTTSTSTWTTSTSTWTSTTTTTTGTTTGACGGTVVSSDLGCQGCMESVCCAELAACAPGTPCGDLLGCVQMCSPGDTGCSPKCEAVYGGGAAELSALLQCGAPTCDACVTPVCDSGVAAQSPLCGSCLSASCCAEMTDCVNDGTCLDCITGQNMEPQCDTSPTFNVIMSCFQGSCGVVCQ